MTWMDRILPHIADLFAEKPIVLVDVGASGEPPANWRILAPLACYIGFDPDQRAIIETNAFGFRRFVMVNRAISGTGQKAVEFFLTRSPYCSSTLKPIQDALDHYGFSELFHVVGKASAPASSLDAALEEVGLDRIDWLKVDSQGTDLRIYESIRLTRRDRLWVLDVEPGMMNFYAGEDAFEDAHRQILRENYWLSSAHFQRYARVSAASRGRLEASGLDPQSLPKSPTAIEAQYFRTLAHVEASGSDVRDLVCVWALAMANGLHGFAMDIAIGMEGQHPIGEKLALCTLAEIRARQSRFGERIKRIAKRWIPASFHPRVAKIAAMGRLHSENPQ